MVRGDTTEQLRADIDSGRTGDKIPALDPATAPLGTDEEAAGTPVPSEVVALTRRIETSRRPMLPEPQTIGHAWILIGAVVALAAGIVSWGASQ